MKRSHSVNKLRNPETFVSRISEIDFRDSLNSATKKSFFTSNKEFYIQVDGVAMGSPLGPIFVNIFLSDYEDNWIDRHPIEFKPTFYRR